MKMKCLWILIALVITLVKAWREGPTQSSPYCAKLYASEGFEGHSFSLRDNEVVQDLSYVDGWKGVEVGENNNDNYNKISIKIQSNCILKYNEESHFKGELHELSGNVRAFELGHGDVNGSLGGSISCSCAKSCSCEDNRYHAQECGRGYQSAEGCNGDCKALYTPFYMPGYRGQSRSKVPHKLAQKIQFYFQRPGCTVKYNTNNLTGTIEVGCTCEPSVRRKIIVSKNPQDPKLLEIPSSRGKLNLEVKKPGLENHPGLLAALQSLRKRRSPRNAYILLLGLTGSGKSTAVNLLFDHPNITQVGSSQSTTSDIHEFRIPIPVPELGISNSELRIIDTPGVADTRGMEQDSRFLATLDSFLGGHEELKGSLPNVIMVMVKFHENRFYGEGSPFVKMLRTIELFREKIMDNSFSNVVYVLTHYMSETKDMQRDPSAKINAFKKAIEEFSTLPKPIVLVLAENKPEESELPSVNGFWQLPNGDYYPRNLFDQLQRSLRSCSDPIGLSIIQSAFSHPDISSQQIKSSSYVLLPSTNSKVTKYLSILSSMVLSGSSSEITSALDNVYENSSIIPPALKQLYPEALNQLKRVFSMKKLRQLNELPKTSIELQKFFKSVQINPITLLMLENGLNITLPHLGSNNMQLLSVGYGYDLISDRNIYSPIFELGDFQPDPELCFQVPKALKVIPVNKVMNVLSISTSREDYVKTRFGQLGLQLDEGVGKNLLQNIQPGFNIVSAEINEDEPMEISALMEYHKFQLGLSAEDLDSITINNGFLQALRSLGGSFNPHDWESVRQWNAFIQTYGTHVLVKAYAGGSIHVKIKMLQKQNKELGSNISSSSPDEVFIIADYDEDYVGDEPSHPGTNSNHLQQQFSILTQTMSQILEYFANNFIGKEIPIVIPEGITYSIEMHGGNSIYYVQNVTHHKSVSETEIWNILDKWQKSLEFQPQLLRSELELVPIAVILRKFLNPDSFQIVDAYEKAVSNYLNSSLVYVPLTRSLGQDQSLETRSQSGVSTETVGDFESMQQFAQVFKMIADDSKKMQERFMEMIMANQRDNEQQSAIFEQRQREERQHMMEQARIQEEKERWLTEQENRREDQRAAREQELRVFEMQQAAAAHEAKLQRDAQMQQLEAQNRANFMQFIQAENQRQHELYLADMQRRQSEKSWLDKTFDFVGGIFGGTQQSASQMAPLINAAAMAG